MVQMLECDPDLAQYAVLYIGGTTFTSPGINVLGRTHRDLPDGLLQAITARISKVQRTCAGLSGQWAPCLPCGHQALTCMEWQHHRMCWHACHAATTVSSTQSQCLSHMHLAM
jgi:hypothetical protein